MRSCLRGQVRRRLSALQLHVACAGQLLQLLLLSLHGGEYSCLGGATLATRCSFTAMHEELRGSDRLLRHRGVLLLLGAQIVLHATAKRRDYRQTARSRTGAARVSESARRAEGAREALARLQWARLGLHLGDLIHKSEGGSAVARHGAADTPTLPKHHTRTTATTRGQLVHDTTSESGCTG
jgi:hypothetical protein